MTTGAKDATLINRDAAAMMLGRNVDTFANDLPELIESGALHVHRIGIAERFDAAEVAALALSLRPAPPIRVRARHDMAPRSWPVASGVVVQ